MAASPHVSATGRTLGSTLVRFGYPWLMLVGMNGTAIVLAQREAPEACFALFVAVAIALSFAAERLLPYDDGWNLPRGDVGRDWAHVLVNETANSLSLLVLPVMATWNLAGSSLWPTRLPFAVQVLGAVLVFDLVRATRHRDHLDRRIVTTWIGAS